jgi:predicted nucleotidyltransferase
MKSRCDKYSLKTLLMELTTIFSGISELHIFGSRRHRTMSTRSDMDLLLVADRTVAPEDVRDFALSKEPLKNPLKSIQIQD